MDLTVNFENDISSIISFNDPGHIRNVLRLNKKILEELYNAIMLKKTNSKTIFLLSHKPKQKEVFKKWLINTGIYKITPTNYVSLLGSYIKSNLGVETETNKLVRKSLHKPNQFNIVR